MSRTDKYILQDFRGGVQYVLHKICPFGIVTELEAPEKQQMKEEHSDRPFSSRRQEIKLCEARVWWETLKLKAVICVDRGNALAYDLVSY